MNWFNWFYNAAAAVKRQDRAWSARFNIFGIVACVALFILFNDDVCLISSLIFFLLLMWDIDDSFNKEKHAELVRLLAGKCDEVIVLKAEVEKKGEEIKILKMITSVRKDNPIKSNRLVGDKTFAVRFKSFVEEVEAKDPMSEEEKEYLHHVAERLLKWQTKTVKKDSEEYKYLERLGLMPEPSPNTDGHPMSEAQEPKAKKHPAVKKKSKTTENENKD